MKIIKILRIPQVAQYESDVLQILNQYKFEATIMCYRTVIYTYVSGDYINSSAFQEFIDILETSPNTNDRTIIVEYEDESGDIFEDQFIFDYYDRSTNRLQFIML